jgi:hypothetical protein
VAEGTDEAATASAFGYFFGNLNPFGGSGSPSGTVDRPRSFQSPKLRVMQSLGSEPATLLVRISRIFAAKIKFYLEESEAGSY